MKHENPLTKSLSQTSFIYNKFKLSIDCQNSLDSGGSRIEIKTKKKKWVVSDPKMYKISVAFLQWTCYDIYVQMYNIEYKNVANRFGILTYNCSMFNLKIIFQD